MLWSVIRPIVMKIFFVLIYFYGLCYSCDLKLHIWWRAKLILHWYIEKRTTNHKEEDHFLSFIYQPCFMEVRQLQFRELLSFLFGGNWQIQKKRRNWSVFYRTLNYWWCIWLIWLILRSLFIVTAPSRSLNLLINLSGPAAFNLEIPTCNNCFNKIIVSA